MAKFAARTEVAASQSETSLRELLSNYGATNFLSGELMDRATGQKSIYVEFELLDRRIRFNVPLPSREEFRLNAHKNERPDTAIEKDLNQAVRTRWRLLLLVVKAKLEAVEEDILVFEQEFLPNFVTDTGKTVYEILQPSLHQLTASNLPALMAGGRR